MRQTIILPLTFAIAFSLSLLGCGKHSFDEQYDDTLDSSSSNVASSSSGEGSSGSIDAGDQLMLNRINALVDNEYYNRSPRDGRNMNPTGIAVAVYKNGSFYYFNRGYHESEQRTTENRTPITENSISQIASLSKTFTGSLLGYLSQTINPSTGLPYVNLDDPVSKYFDIKPYDDGAIPTLAQLASHSSGFPLSAPNGTTPLTSLQNSLNNVVYEFKPGSGVLYSNFGISVLGNILAKAYYGDDFPTKYFEDLLQELICIPLGLESTSTIPLLFPERTTEAHDFCGAPLTRENLALLSRSAFGINSTSHDMIRWLAMMMGEYVPADMVEFQKGAVKAFEPQAWRNDAKTSAYGLNWRIEINRKVPNGTISPYENNVDSLGSVFKELFPVLSNRGQPYGPVYSHSGANRGQWSFCIISPETKSAVIVMTNHNNGGTERLAYGIMDRALILR